MAKIDTTQRKPIGRIVPGLTVLGRGYISNIPQKHPYFRGHSKTGFKLSARSAKPTQIPNRLIGAARLMFDAFGNEFPMGTSFAAFRAAWHGYIGGITRGVPITAAYAVFDAVSDLVSPDVCPVVCGVGMQINLNVSGSGVRKKTVTICSAGWVAAYNAGHGTSVWTAGFFGIPKRVYGLQIYSGIPGGSEWKPI